MSLTVRATGPLALLTDQGRPGLAAYGVSPSGAADRTAFEVGNRLLGNRAGAVAVEVTAGGLEVEADELTWVAVTGAPTEVLVDGRPTSSHTPIALDAGARLRVTAPAQGLRNYLAVRGGLRAAKTLGSAATDRLSGLGPPPLRVGDRLEARRPRRNMPGVDLAPPNQPRKTLDLTPGPRRDWFHPAAWRSLLASAWSVTTDCDRVGVRLAGPALERAITEELPSEGIVRGALQVPAAGQPLIFLADHPVTGGYPVIAVLTSRAADHAAQLRPGDDVRFRLVRTG